MITGDKAYLSLQTKNYFSVAGLSHILAVSGLHLSVITIFLSFMLRLIRVSRLTNAILVFVFLAIYAYIAGFSPSVLRAAIMSSVGLIVYLFGTQKDMLSSLCFSFCLIVLFAPFYLFEASFILSFCCVFGIVLFSRPIKKLLLKIKIPKFLASTIAISTAVQIGLLPAIIYLFNSIQPYSIIVNIIAVPFVMLLFIVIFSCLILSSLLPPLSITFKFPKLGLMALDYFAASISTLPFAKVIVYFLPIIFLIYVLYFLSSPFFMVKRRWILQILSLFLCVLLIIAQNPPMAKKHSLAPIDNNYSALTYITNDDKSYLCGDIWSGNITLEKLKALKVQKINAIFLEKINIDIARQIVVISGFYSDFTLYYPRVTEDEEGKIKKILGKIKIVSFTKNDLLTNDFAAVFVGSEFCGYQFTAIENTKIFLPKNYFRYDKYDFVNQYNIIRAYKFYNLNSLENKILLIGEKAEGKNIYSFAEKRYIYNYLTFEFDYM